MTSRKQKYSDRDEEEVLFGGSPIPVLDSESVDQSSLKADLICFIKKYVVLDDRWALIIALWLINTWGFYKNFNVCPILAINAPEKECGKSQLLNLIKLLAYRPVVGSNFTVAVIFRLVNKYSPTLLMDEADTYMDSKSDLPGLLNAGCENGGQFWRMETVGKEMVVRRFQVFSPKAIAGINLNRILKSATWSRCLAIPMTRKAREVKVGRLHAVDRQLVDSLRSRMHWLALEYGDKLTGCAELPAQLGDRECDYAEPLLCIAGLLGCYDEAVEAFVALSKDATPSNSASNQLLEDVREVVQGWEDRFIATVDLLERLNRHPDMEWRYHNHGQPLTSRQLARYLGAYNIKPKTVRLSSDYTPKGYELRQFDEAFARYLSEPTPEEPEEETGVDRYLAQQQAEFEDFKEKMIRDGSSPSVPDF